MLSRNKLVAIKASRLFGNHVHSVLCNNNESKMWTNILGDCRKQKLYE